MSVAAVSYLRLFHRAPYQRLRCTVSYSVALCHIQQTQFKVLLPCPSTFSKANLQNAEKNKPKPENQLLLVSRLPLNTSFFFLLCVCYIPVFMILTLSLPHHLPHPFMRALCPLCSLSAALSRLKGCQCGFFSLLILFQRGPGDPALAPARLGSARLSQLSSPNSPQTQS